MPIPSWIVQPFALLFLAWLHFARVAERLSPFRPPPTPLARRRWLHARRTGLAVLLGGACAAAASVQASASTRAVLASGALGYAAVALPSTIAYLGRGSLGARLGASLRRRPRRRGRRRRSRG